MVLKQKTRIHPSLDLDISFEFTKIIDCMTKEHTSMMVDKLERLKNEKFEKILIPEFEYEVEGNILTQRVEYIKGRQCGMTVKKYRDKIYKEFVERDSDWTFCDFKYDNFIVVNGIDKDKIYAIDFQSYNYLPSRKERLDLWEEYLETNNLVLEYITRELPFRKRKKNDKHNN